MANTCDLLLTKKKVGHGVPLRLILCCRQGITIIIHALSSIFIFSHLYYNVHTFFKNNNKKLNIVVVIKSYVSMLKKVHLTIK